MDSIAIIGMGCRFPAAPNPHAFWQLLCNGIDAITEVPSDRYDINAVYDPHPATPGKVMTRKGGFLDQVDQFDAAFFGLSPREASRIDPQHRLLLEVAWEAMEDAGLIPEKLTDEIASVFIGIITGDYWDRQFHNPTDLDVYSTAGSARSGAAGRISYALGLRGMSVALDAACSSSLVAVHLACQNLRAKSSTLALAGGVNIILNPDHTIGFSQGRMMAPDGHCKAFDAHADGYVRSEGAGIVVLKLLSRALADGDPIYAVIRGSASNNDGHSELFMAPSEEGQQAGLRQAYHDAAVDPLSVHYVEAHGTGTSVGDPVEIKALGSVLCKGRPANNPLLVGSAKTNIGHTEGAAGLAGLIKAALCLKHKMIPPNLHFHQPNPAIPWQNYALMIPTQLTPWPSSATPRRAGVSSFGIAGTNAHIVLEEAPAAIASSTRPDNTQHQTYLLPLSAQTHEGLKDLARNYMQHLVREQEYSDQTLHDICYTASLRRTHHDYRLAIITHSRQDTQHKLETFIHDETGMELVSGHKIANKQCKIAWIFSGQGSQWPGMGRDLLKQEPVFRASIEECDRAISPYVDWSLLDLLLADEEHAALKHIDVIQPLLFAIEVALAALWRSWGIQPDVVVGHSMGEVAAAYIAGALSMDDAAWIICSRSKLLLRTSGKGAMAVIDLPLNQARTIVADYKERVSVAVNNSPRSTVLSGDPKALAEILDTLSDNDIPGRLVNVDVASHSPQMDLLHDDLLELMQRVQPRSTKLPMFSTVYGRLVDGNELVGCYWVDNLREPVLFFTAIQHLLEDDFDIFMEMCPHPILVAPIRQTIELSEKSGLALASMRRNEAARNIMLTTLGQLYTHGCEPDWSRLYLDGGLHVSLPSYPWQRQRYWNATLDHPQSLFLTQHRNSIGHPILGTGIQSALHPTTYFWTTDINTERFPYLNEHCVHDIPVLPCAAYIELALAAPIEVFGTQHFSIKDLELKKALFLPKGNTQTLQVILTSEGIEGKLRLHFFSTQTLHNTKQAEWTLHASVTIQHEEEPPTKEMIIHPTPEEVQHQWTLAMETDLHYQGLRARGIQHGPLFQGITHIWQHPGEVMAHLTIPAGVTNDSPGYQMHPALIDAFLQGIIPFLPEEHERNAYVPVAIKRIKFHQQPEHDTTLWSHAIMQSETHGAQNVLEGDIILLNEQGQVLLEVLGCRLQSLDGATPDFMRQRLNQLLYTIEWELQTRNKPTEKRTSYKNWLIFGANDGIGQRLMEYLQARGANCVMVTAGCFYKQISNQQYELSPEAPEQFERLFRDVYRQNAEHVSGIVYLWGMVAPALTTDTRHPLHTEQEEVSIGALHLVQALATTKQEISPRLWLVTSGVHALQSQEQTSGLLQAPLWGLGRVIVYEHQHLHCTLIDLDATHSEICITALCQEIWSNETEDEVVLRSDKRYIARLTHYTLPDKNKQKQAKALFSPDGTYLITGGLGGIGLCTAQWMVEQGTRHLVLMGRRGVPAEAEAILQAMRETGADVRILKADVAHEEDLEKALIQIRRTMPPLRGIFHSAVVLDDSTLLHLNRERFLSVMPPKVNGAWNLHRMTLDDPLDYFVLFSSAASLIGSPGQGNYAAASAFMDILAHYRKQQGYPALCINWGRWGEVGQATKENRGERLDARGFASMKPKEGLAILAGLLHQNVPQVGAMSFNLPQWSQFYPGLARSSLFAHLSEETRTEIMTLPSLTSALLTNLDTIQRQQKLAQYLSNQIARVLGHTSLKLDAHQLLNRLGIDSLMSVELKNRIGSDLNVVIPVTTFLQGITFEQLITQIMEQI